jgi:GTP-binding protein LepA
MANIRNFCIIAHIDHGKSTLADRLLELTGTVDKRKMHDQYMDTLELEQERGITIKLQTARMKYTHNGESFVLNLIDTPGHVDFAYEVSRSLAACEGAILLVDATQGVEAQTLSTVMQALDHNLEIIPVLNKIDLPNADIERRSKEIEEVLGFSRDEILLASGKTGEGVDTILQRIVERIPAPKKSDSTDLQALIFDSFYDEFKGVVCVVKLVSGDVEGLKKMYLLQSHTEFSPIEVGYLTPYMTPSTGIKEGEVGYIATGLKDIHAVGVGDTISLSKETPPLEGYRKVKPMVFAGIYPIDVDEQKEFKEAVEKLGLNDAAFSYEKENSPALGFGYRCGFLGLLHMDIVKERLEREFNADILVTNPTTEYIIKRRGHSEEEKIISTYGFKQEEIEYIKEPWVKMEIYTPGQYIGDVMSLCYGKRGEYINTQYFGAKETLARVLITFSLPLAEIITDFFDQLKSLTQGYASMDYELLDYRQSDIVKLDIVVNYEIIEPLSLFIHESRAEEKGRALVKELKEIIPKQLFKIPLQAMVGAKIVAREDISAFKKDVTAKLYGGDITRRMKLWEKQKKGKKRLKTFGKVEIPQEAFLAASRI